MIVVLHGTRSVPSEYALRLILLFTLQEEEEKSTRQRWETGVHQRQDRSREQLQHKADLRQEMAEKERMAAIKATEKRV
jgi:hypothetical protein